MSIDELICPEEIISAAEDEKKECLDKYVLLICSILDVLFVLLLLVPVFGNGADSPSSVSLFAITCISTWVKWVFIALVGLSILNGICGIIISHFNKPIWYRHRLITGMVLSTAGAALFILTRQPYAGIIYLVILVLKGLLIEKGKSL